MNSTGSPGPVVDNNNRFIRNSRPLKIAQFMRGQPPLRAYTNGIILDFSTLGKLKDDPFSYWTDSVVF